MLFSPNLGFSVFIFPSVFSSKAAKSRFLPFYFLPNHQFFALRKTNFSKQKCAFLDIFNHKKRKTTSHCKYTTIHLRRNMQHLYCVLYELVLHLARVSIAFSTSQHCVLQEIALHFAANSPHFRQNSGFLTLKHIVLYLHVIAFLQCDKSSRESIICARVSVCLQRRHS